MKNNAITSILFLILFFLPKPNWAQDSMAIQQLLREAKTANSRDAAYEKYLSAYSLSRQINYPVGLQKALPNLSKWELEQQNTAAALRYLLEELEILKKSGEIDRIIQIEYSIGDIYFSERLYAESLPYYRQVNQKIDKKGGNKKATILKKIGNTYK